MRALLYLAAAPFVCVTLDVIFYDLLMAFAHGVGFLLGCG